MTCPISEARDRPSWLRRDVQVEWRDRAMEDRAERDQAYICERGGRRINPASGDRVGSGRERCTVCAAMQDSWGTLDAFPLQALQLRPGYRITCPFVPLTSRISPARGGELSRSVSNCHLCFRSRISAPAFSRFRIALCRYRRPSEKTPHHISNAAYDVTRTAASQGGY